MEIRNFTPEQAFQIRMNQNFFTENSDDFLAADLFFQIGFRYFKKGHPAKEVYLPLKSNEALKESFVLAEIFPRRNDYLIRSRHQNQVQAISSGQNELFYHLSQIRRFYTTLSLDEELLEWPFENCLSDGFSLLHFCHEALKGGGPIQNIRIIADPGGTLPKSYEEGEALYRFFKETVPFIPVSFYAKTLSPHEMNQILCQGTLVHFSGHIESSGLWLGKEFYSPSHFSHPLPSLLFLNGCTLSPALLTSFIQRKAKNIVYFKMHQKDHEVDLEKLKKFYLGILLGYRVGDCARATLDFRKARLYGWMTNRFTF